MEPSSDLLHPHLCLNYKSASGCKYGDCCQCRLTEAGGGQPSKKSKKKWWERISGTVEKDCSIGLCPKIAIGKSILWEVGKLGSNHDVKFSKGTWHPVKNRERKGPSQ